MVTLEKGQELVEAVQEQLRQEHWTRAAIDSYNRKSFEDLDKILQEAREQHIQGQLLMVCLDYLAVSPKSIIALYLSGVLHLEQGEIFDNPLYQLIVLFKENSRLNVVEFLANRLLEYGEDRFALVTLQNVYEFNGQEHELVEIWKRIVQIDFENAEIAHKLGEYYEGESDPDQAVKYHQIAIRRFAVRSMVSKVEDIWKALVRLAPDDVNALTSIENELAMRFPKEIAGLLMLNADYFLQKEEHSKALSIYKRICRYDSSILALPENVLTCLGALYSEHSLYREFLQESGLRDVSGEDFGKAIADFEKRISFDLGNYVHHRSWGVGTITRVEGDNLTISFRGRPSHQMSLAMALKSLLVLDEGHLWVIKDSDPDSLKDMSEEAICRTLKLFFRAYNLQGASKLLKAELVPNIVSAKIWPRWWTLARKVIKSHPSFGSNPTRKDMYFLRDRPITVEEEAIYHFSAVKTFGQRLTVFLNYVRITDSYEGEGFMEMASTFVDSANKNIENISERNVQSYLALSLIKKQVPALFSQVKVRPEDIYNMPEEDLAAIFAGTSDPGLKRELLSLIFQHKSESWDKFYRLAFQTPVTRAHDSIIEHWVAEASIDSINWGLHELIRNPRSNLELFAWAIKIIFKSAKLREYLSFDLEEQIVNMFKLMDYIHREIESRKDVTLHRRIFNILSGILIREEWVKRLIDQLPEVDKARRIARLVRDMLSMEERHKIAILQHIESVFSEVRVGDNSDFRKKRKSVVR